MSSEPPQDSSTSRKTLSPSAPLLRPSSLPPKSNMISSNMGKRSHKGAAPHLSLTPTAFFGLGGGSSSSTTTTTTTHPSPHQLEAIEQSLLAEVDGGRAQDSSSGQGGGALHTHSSPPPASPKGPMASEVMQLISARRDLDTRLLAMVKEVDLESSRCKELKEAAVAAERQLGLEKKAKEESAESYERQLAELQRQLADAQKEAAEHISARRELDSEVQEARAAVSNARKEAAGLEEVGEQMRQMEAQMRQMRADSEAAAARHAQEVNNMSNTIEFQRRELARLEGDCHSMATFIQQQQLASEQLLMRQQAPHPQDMKHPEGGAGNSRVPPGFTVSGFPPPNMGNTGEVQHMEGGRGLAQGDGSQAPFYGPGLGGPHPDMQGLPPMSNSHLGQGPPGMMPPGMGLSPYGEAGHMSFGGYRQMPGQHQHQHRGLGPHGGAGTTVHSGGSTEDNAGDRLAPGRGGPYGQDGGFGQGFGHEGGLSSADREVPQSEDPSQAGSFQAGTYRPTDILVGGFSQLDGHARAPGSPLKASQPGASLAPPYVPAPTGPPAGHEHRLSSGAVPHSTVLLTPMAPGDVGDIPLPQFLATLKKPVTQPPRADGPQASSGTQPPAQQPTPAPASSAGQAGTCAGPGAGARPSKAPEATSAPASNQGKHKGKQGPVAGVGAVTGAMPKAGQAGQPDPQPNGSMGRSPPSKPQAAQGSAPKPSSAPINKAQPQKLQQQAAPVQASAAGLQGRSGKGGGKGGNGPTKGVHKYEGSNGLTKG